MFLWGIWGYGDRVYGDMGLCIISGYVGFVKKRL